MTINKHQNLARQTLEWRIPHFDLASTLQSGQSFCWRKKEREWSGWINQIPCFLSQAKETIRCESAEVLSASKVKEFLQVDEPILKIQNSFPKDDPWLLKSIAFCPGIRILKSDPWETTCMFICSAMKQVRHIEQMNDRLREKLGNRFNGNLSSFPTPRQIAQTDESTLRSCGLGFRAPHLLKTARAVDEGLVNLQKIAQSSTADARENLLQLRGVGEKVANCILLYAYHRLEVVPIDIWIERILKKLYLKKGRKINRAKMQSFAETHFGPYAGYAQQYLFHWVRMTKGSELP